MNRRGTFYAHTKNNARVYSPYVVEYELTQNVRLIDMGNPENIKKLLESLSSDSLRHKLAKAFRIVNGEVRRHSKLKYDAFVAELACQLGYDGYYADRLRTKYPEGFLAPEIVLCNPPGVLRITDKFRNGESVVPLKTVSTFSRSPLRSIQSPQKTPASTLKRKRIAVNSNRVRPNTSKENYRLRSPSDTIR